MRKKGNVSEGYVLFVCAELAGAGKEKNKKRNSNKKRVKGMRIGKLHMNMKNKPLKWEVVNMR